MGLFGFNKKEKPIIVPEPDKSKVEWFFTEEAKERFKILVRRYADDMQEVWFSGENNMIGAILEKGNPYRQEFPCTFFADYLRAIKTMASPALAFVATDLAIDGDGGEAIPYPDCLKPEFNPLINFAIKIKPIYYSKNGGDLEYNFGMRCVIEYLHSAFIKGVDASNESWIYEKSLWFNEKGKTREHYEIVSDLKTKGNRKFLDFLD